MSCTILQQRFERERQDCFVIISSKLPQSSSGHLRKLESPNPHFNRLSLQCLLSILNCRLKVQHFDHSSPCLKNYLKSRTFSYPYLRSFFHLERSLHAARENDYKSPCVVKKRDENEKRIEICIQRQQCYN